MPPLFTITKDVSGPVRLFQQLQAGVGLLRLAVGRAAIRSQSDVRAGLDQMIYSTPERSYKRTWTLMRSSHAAPPGVDHSGDFSTARSGADLAATDPSKVVSGDAIGGPWVSEIGSWIYYARFVHGGTARMPSRPFLSAAAAMAEAHLRSEVATAVAEMLRSRGGA